MYERATESVSARRYLGCGEWPALPIIFFLTASSYVLMGLLWGVNMFYNWEAVRPVHWLALAAVVLKALAVLFHAIREVSLALTGYAATYSAFWYAFRTINGIIVFAVVILLGSGWNTVKEYVTARERKVITVVLVLQIAINIAFAFEDDALEGSRLALEWRTALRVLEILGCIAVVLPMFWAARALTTAASADGKAAQTVRHLYLFRFFYVVLLVWLYVTRVLVPLIRPQLGYTTVWVAGFMYEVATLFFFGAVGFAFRPVVVYGGRFSGLGGGGGGFLSWIRRGGGAAVVPGAASVGVGFARNALEEDEDGSFLTGECLQELEMVHDRTVHELAEAAASRVAEGRQGAHLNSVNAAMTQSRIHRE